ncbi:pentatricopeptide repeat-containing protein At3g09040, mitochondrial-like [Arachis hypogaea]|uniref:pentatricopeptide repeat-containing protein At3g09040, mitochondrial-like n=1 Tax=Arachis hypogaea TaxID=3818 RepID=UPI003B20E5DB
MELFLDMTQRTIELDEFTFTGILSSCACFESLEIGRQNEVTWHSTDEVALASILSACGNAKLLEAGLQFHCLAVKLGLEANLFVGGSLIDMYSKCWSIEDARKIYSSMPEWSVVSMNALISGYALKNIKEAINLLSEMLALGLKPSEITFASLIDACKGSQVILGLQIHCAIVKRGLLCGS